ncbi:unnamed protein product [Brassica rapa subsp. trilocularis]
MKKEYKTDASMGQTQGVDSKGKGKESQGTVLTLKARAKKFSVRRQGQSTALTLKAKDKEVSGSLMGQNQSVGEIITGPSPFDDLPEDCISNIVAFTSPRDACVSSSVSKTFESAVRSDSVWEKFLPLDYTSLAPASRAFSSKRELYFALCDHFLIDDDKKSFWLEKGSGKKCVMLAARALWITWGSSPEYWQWISMPESRFEEVAELRNVCAFEMGGTMNTQVLSPGTHYSAYFVYKIRNQRHGFRDLPIQVGVGFKGQDMPKNFICFDLSNDVNKQWPRKELMKSEKREDGWIEAEIGDFFNEEGCDEIEVSIVDITSGNWKCGVIIQGIEFRPRDCRLYILKFVFEKSRLKLRTVTTEYSEKFVCRQHSMFLSSASLLYHHKCITKSLALSSIIRTQTRLIQTQGMGQKNSVEYRVEGKGDIVTGPSPFDDLPVECISNIISFTSPRDACVVASVSKTFGSAVQSDSIWEKFLPLGYASMIPQPRAFSTKELYFALCDHFLIEDGKNSFWLDKASGKKCVMVSAKELAITWGNSPQHWQWISIPESRFEKVAELLSVWWFEIRGKMNTRLIFLGTRYSAYIVFKTVNKCPGLADLPVEVGVGLVGQEIPKQLIYFDGYMDKDAKKERGEMRDVMKPKKREDGWMEAELGEFFNEEGCNEIELSVIEIKSPYWKCGLIIQGIEFRPTTSR